MEPFAKVAELATMNPLEMQALLIGCGGHWEWWFAAYDGREIEGPCILGSIAVIVLHLAC